jgi:hypothetical protein
MARQLDEDIVLKVAFAMVCEQIRSLDTEISRQVLDRMVRAGLSGFRSYIAKNPGRLAEARVVINAYLDAVETA